MATETRWVSNQIREGGPLQVDGDSVSPDTLYLVIATKYTTNFMGGPPGEGRIVSAATLVPGR